MGVLNVTPDSFSDGGRFPRRLTPRPSPRGVALADAGAAIIDVGGEFDPARSRTGFAGSEEIARVRRMIVKAFWPIAD